MRAAVRTRYGPPEVVRIAEVDRPGIRDNEVLVRVHATTVNRTDCGIRAARPFFMRLFTGLAKPRVAILGSEFAGEIAEVGGRVTSFAVGDRVFGFTEGPFGAHAEYLAIRADRFLATIPAGLSHTQAAPGTEGSHYALALIRTARIQAGQDVLVNGATGAIGSAAVQLLKGIGAHVTAVCATEHMELVRGLGADRVIDYTAEDFTKDEQTYDVVLDAVGKSSFGRCRRLLRPKGKFLSTELGALSQNALLALVTPLFRGKRVMFPIPKQGDDMARHLKELIESGGFTPLIDRQYPLDQIVEAYDYVESGRKVGNVVINIVPPGPAD